MNEIYNIVISFFSELFLNPQKRVFLGYLVSASLIGILWLIFFKRTTVKSAFSTVFSKEVWFSYSATSDYLLLIFNKVIMSFISPRLIGQVIIATFWFELLHQWFTPDKIDDWPKWLIMTLFTLTLFILDDSSKYLLHRCLHKSAILWRFHRVHHSAINLTPLTIFRTHPIEAILFTIRSAIIQGVCIGIFVFLFGSQVELINILGINFLLFFFNVLGANLRHSHVPIHYYRAVENWLMSPAQHQLHHSTDPQHFDKNFGVILTIWDRIGGSFHYSEVGGKLQFGIIENGSLIKCSVTELYYLPFIESFKLLNTHLNRFSQKYLIYIKGR